MLNFQGQSEANESELNNFQKTTFESLKRISFAAKRNCIYLSPCYLSAIQIRKLIKPKPQKLVTPNGIFIQIDPFFPISNVV